MRVVALTELKGDVDAEVPAIATLLGVSPYDVKARLVGGLPRVVFQTPDLEAAKKVFDALVARGYGVVSCDAGDAVAGARMVKLRRFAMDATGMWANDGAGARLEWADLGAVVVATVKTEVSRTKDEVDFQMRMESAPTKVTYEVTRAEHGSTHVAYLFPHPRAASKTPWLLEELHAQFLSLGSAMQPTRRANFLTTIALFRRHAPHALVDDRFVTSPQHASTVTRVHGTVDVTPPSSSANVDLAAHILADWLMRDRSGPYRG